MSPFPVGQVGISETTMDRADRLILPVAEFRNADVREAVRSLFRRGLFGGTIAPDVQGTVTLSLKNVPWTTVLQSVLRQVDATYRIDHGFYEVVRREDPYDPVIPDLREPVIRERYAEIARAVAAGKGDVVRRSLRNAFSVSSAKETFEEEAAVRRFIITFREYPTFTVENVWWRSAPVDTVEVIVRYERAGSEPVRYWDVWQQYPNEPWRLIEREEAFPNSPMRFVNVPLAKVLKKVFRRGGVSYTLDPRLDRNQLVTVDLAGLPFESTLQRLTQRVGLTYRIEGGVYQFLPRE